VVLAGARQIAESFREVAQRRLQVATGGLAHPSASEQRLRGVDPQPSIVGSIEVERAQMREGDRGSRRAGIIVDREQGVVRFVERRARGIGLAQLPGDLADGQRGAALDRSPVALGSGPGRACEPERPAAFAGVPQRLGAGEVAVDGGGHPIVFERVRPGSFGGGGRLARRGGNPQGRRQGRDRREPPSSSLRTAASFERPEQVGHRGVAIACLR